MDEAPPPGVVEQPATPEIKEEDNAEEPPAAEEEKPEESTLTLKSFAELNVLFIDLCVMTYSLITAKGTKCF